MLARRAVATSLAIAMGAGGLLGGCSLEPVPIGEEQRTDETAVEGKSFGTRGTSTADEKKATDGTEGADAIAVAGQQETATDRIATGSSSSVRNDDKVLLVRDSEAASTVGTDERSDGEGDETSSPIVTKGDDGRQHDGISGKSRRFLSFRCDQDAPEYPSPIESRDDASPYVVSYLPAVVAMDGRKAYVVELSVTYESGDGTETGFVYDEARWLADVVRREVVRLVTSGVAGKGNLEDALAESVGARRTRGTVAADGTPTVTEIDVYNIFVTDSDAHGFVTRTDGTGSTVITDEQNE